ncbi:MAG: acyl-CoA thioesterase [Nitrospirota bacterium]|nr:acyl-CoA thioesterase [Nitrospirota bacterium]
MSKPYFKSKPEHPAPLRAVVSRTVRFEEVDPLGIVWHGRYPGYFEDGRVALGKRFGIGYMDFYNAGVVTPIKQIYVEYHRSLSFDASFSIEAILHWSEAARMNFEFILRDTQGLIATTGYTVQMMMDRENNFLLAQPPFYREFCQRWLAGEIA